MYIDLNKTYGRKHVSSDFTTDNKDTNLQEFNKLLSRQINSQDSIHLFLEHWSELMSIIEESASMAYVNMTINTKDKEAEEKYLYIIENISPLVEEYSHKLKEKLIASPILKDLDNSYYNVFIKSIQTDIEIYKEENILLNVEDSKYSQNYQKISGSWMVEFEGKKYTTQQMALFLEETDRLVREKAYRARVEVHLNDLGALEDLYDSMLVNRNKIAINSGVKNFQEYMFKAKHRFDYSPKDCLKFHDSIQEIVVPVLSEWMELKAKKLHIDSIRPWDLYVDPDGIGVIKAFKDDKELCSKVSSVFNQMDPSLGKDFDFMLQNNLLDLASREGKAPGGYMTDLTERRLPFIFMNAVGTRRDIDTLLHEMGHSIHAIQAREQPLFFYRSSPLEFAEVASMSMELLGRKYFHLIYSPDQIEIVKKDQLKKILEFFPFMSMIDSFQHWVYTVDENDRVARGDKWLELHHQFQPFINISGIENIAKTRWQYPHIYTVPFYYIEYGIAQIGALQVWKNSLQNEKNALKKYLDALSLGGSKYLPDLFQTAGASFSMGKDLLKELVDLIREEIGE